MQVVEVVVIQVKQDEGGRGGRRVNAGKKVVLKGKETYRLLSASQYRP